MAEITTNKEALEYLFVSPITLKELATNIFQNQSSFRVKVITRPVFYTGDPNDLESIELVGSDPGSVSPKMIFKGRILDSNMAHENFLEDPCDPAFADDPETAAVLTSLHTSIILDTSDETDSVKIGDIILCDSTAGDANNVYDLQFMKMTKVLDVVPDSVSGEDLLSDCTSLSELFESLGLSEGDEDGPRSLTAIYGPEAGEIEFEDGACESGDFILIHPLGALQQSNSPYGPRVLNGKRQNHQGIDFAQDGGVPIYATADGNVTLAIDYCKVGDRNCGGHYGNSVYIQHTGIGEGFETRYAHMSQVVVSQGPVTQGQIIGYVGTTGYSTGNHLHFELLQGGSKINPAPYIKAEKCQPLESLA